MFQHRPVCEKRAAPLRLAYLLAFATLMLFATICIVAKAGELKKADIERRFGPPFQVQEKLTDIPAWPLTSSLEQEAGPVAYVFESIDLAPLPGFEGTPMNFLISIDRKGNFIDVEVLRQREPVFTFRDLGGLGDTPLREFIAQYAGRKINQPYIIALDAARNRKGTTGADLGTATLDGISKATTSVRIVNQTVLSAALDVARAKLGFADRKSSGPAAQVRTDVYDHVTFDEMLSNGMVGHLRLTNADVEKLFVGSAGANVDAEALAHPDEVFVDFYVAYLNAPTIGRAILGDDQYAEVMERNFRHHHLWWIGTAGRYVIADGDFVPGAQSLKLALEQDGGFLEFRDQDIEPRNIPVGQGLNTSRLFGVKADASLDPARPVELSLRIVRTKGEMLPTLVPKQAVLAYAPPARLFSYPPKPLPAWVLAWQARWIDLTVLGSALVVLVAVLSKPAWLSRSPRRLRVFRLGFLGFTLFYVGWYAQGQLSIVQITGAIKTLRAGLGLASYLYDPVSIVLIGFTVLTFVVWGRGTFCGWLCPFGALQEFVGRVARFLRLPRLPITRALGRRLESLRYLVLAVLIGAALFAPEVGEALNEVEPFKTAITVGFDRGWPFVVYAAILLLAGAFYYKFFCRFICPLGAAMSLGGRLRLFDWLKRRAECGKPCQRCKAECEYDAIEDNGEVAYGRCFQCLDCVGIYHDETRCAPIMLYRKKGKIIVPQVLGSPASIRSN